MTVVGPLDAMFLGAETRAQPMHVGGLMLFELLEGAGRDQAFPEGARDFVLRLYQDMLGTQQINPLFARRVRNRTRDLGYWSWEQEPETTSSTTSGCRHCPVPAGTASCSS